MGKLILITGGARSGKSGHAERLAAELGGDDLTIIATAEALDDEMMRRIERHKTERPRAWKTVEAPHAAASALAAVQTRVAIVDCLTLLASNALLAAESQGQEAAERAVVDEATKLRDAALAREGITIVVTNEVGLGVHPPTALGRWFQDALGRGNQMLAATAGEVILMVCGIAAIIKSEGEE